MQKLTENLDAGFNISAGFIPQDSDPDSSTNGYQLLDDLQIELREKSHLVNVLRRQLEFSEKHNDDAYATITAQRDELLSRVNILIEENRTLQERKQNNEDDLELLLQKEVELQSGQEQLDIKQRQLETSRRQLKRLEDKCEALESEKQILQELLIKSKEECHRINEMYASRQAALLEENETFKNKFANLSTEFQDQQEYLHQVASEKICLERELKDFFDKSNYSPLHFDKSIDISFTEDQMFERQPQFNEEVFTKDLSNNNNNNNNHISIYEEIRLSLSTDAKISTLQDSPCKITKESTPLFIETDSIVLPKVCNQEDISCDECVSLYMKTCINCESLLANNAQLKADLCKAIQTITDMKIEFDKYEDNLAKLQNCISDAKAHDKYFKQVSAVLSGESTRIQAALDAQTILLDQLNCDKLCAAVQTESVRAMMVNIATQTEDIQVVSSKNEIPKVPATQPRRFIWSALKSLFTLFAVVCLLTSLLFIYNATQHHYSGRRCRRDSELLSWKWFSVQDILDFMFKIEYIGEVPM